MSGGTLNDAASATPTWTRPTVTADTDFSINLTVTVRGTGTSAADGTSDTASAAAVTATVRNVVAIPDAAAPTVTIAAVGSITENETLGLSVSVVGGTYDALAYAWIVVSGGGSLSGETTATPTYTPADISADATVRVRVTVTATGDGTNAATGTSDTATDTEDFTVTFVVPPVQPVAGTFDIGDLPVGGDWEGAFLLPAYLVEGGGVAWYRRFSNFGSGYVRFNTGATETASISATSLGLTNTWEDYAEALRFTDDAGNTVVIPGPNHPTGRLTDETEEYVWRVSTDVEALVDVFFGVARTGVVLTLLDGTESVTAPDAVAPTVTIQAVDSVRENETLDLVASIASDGTFDTINYAWRIVSGGGSIVPVVGNGLRATYTPPDVASDATAEVEITATARGTGTNARVGTEDTSTDTEQFTVTAVTTTAAPAERLTTIADLEAFFSRVNRSDAGGWTADAGGTTVSSNTGPGTNSAGPYVYSEFSGSGTGDERSGNSILTALATTMAGWTGGGRTFRCRASVAGAFGADDGLLFESRLTSGNWTPITTLIGWLYLETPIIGDTITDASGAARTVVQDGGWVDFEVALPDGHDQFRITVVPNSDTIVRHDAALWAVEFVDGSGPVPVVTFDTDTIWRLSASTPAIPSGGTTQEQHTPTGWTRNQPDATTTLGVWRLTRTRTYTDDVFTSATAWGNLSEIEEALPAAALAHVIAVASRATDDIIHIFGQDDTDTYGIWTLTPGGTATRLSVSSVLRAILNNLGPDVGGMTRHREPETGGASLLVVQNAANGIPAILLLSCSDTALTRIDAWGNVLAMDGETAESIAVESDNELLIGAASGRLWRLDFDYAVGSFGLASPLAYRHPDEVVGLSRVTSGHLDDVVPDIDRWLDVEEFGDAKRVVVIAQAGDNRDQVTVSRLTAGSSGLTVLATNEAIVLPADDMGVVSSYAGAGGEIRVYRGSTRLTSGLSFARVAASASLGATVSAAGVYAITSLADDTDSANLTIRVTVDGEAVIDKIITVAKAKQGRRGVGTFSRRITGSAWTEAEADAATPGDNQVGDRVTLYNPAAVPPFAETRTWDGFNWVIYVEVIDGSLLVLGTVAAEALKIGDEFGIDASGHLIIRELTAEQVTANLRNWEGLWGGVSTLDSVDRVFSLARDLNEYHYIAVLQRYTVDQEEMLTFRETHFFDALSTDEQPSFLKPAGSDQSRNYMILRRTGQLQVNLRTRLGVAEIIGIWGVKNPVAVDTDDVSQTLSVTPLTLDIEEGDGAAITVVLVARPPLDVVVRVGTTNPDLSADDDALTFTPANWDTDQTVIISADNDTDTEDETGSVLLEATGGLVAKATVEVRITDKGGILNPPGAPGTPTLVSRTQNSLTLRTTPGGGGPATLYRWRYTDQYQQPGAYYPSHHRRDAGHDQRPKCEHDLLCRRSGGERRRRKRLLESREFHNCGHLRPAGPLEPARHAVNADLCQRVANRDHREDDARRRRHADALSLAIFNQFIGH